MCVCVCVCMCVYVRVCWKKEKQHMKFENCITKNTQHMTQHMQELFIYVQK